MAVATLAGWTKISGPISTALIEWDNVIQGSRYGFTQVAQPAVKVPPRLELECRREPAGIKTSPYIHRPEEVDPQSTFVASAIFKTRFRDRRFVPRREVRVVSAKATRVFIQSLPVLLFPVLPIPLLTLFSFRVGEIPVSVDAVDFAAVITATTIGVAFQTWLFSGEPVFRH